MRKQSELPHEVFTYLPLPMCVARVEDLKKGVPLFHRVLFGHCWQTKVILFTLQARDSWIIVMRKENVT